MNFKLLPPIIAVVSALVSCTTNPQKTPSKDSVSENDSMSYEVTNKLVSPNDRMGVTIPAEDRIDGGNQLIELATGKIIATLPGWPASDRMNHGGYEGKWSKDNCLFLWIKYGKWSSDSVVVCKLSQGSVLWINNLTPACQKAILDGVKKAVPNAYAEEVKETKQAQDTYFKKFHEPDRTVDYIKSYGSTVYPDGFTVDVRIGGGPDANPKLPMQIKVDLTSEPKYIEGLDPEKIIDAWLDGVLDPNGVLTFGPIHMGRRPNLHNQWSG